jgi:SAM-dependent methyltransferase
MAKKIKFESFVFRFLIAAQQLQFAPKDKQSKPWSDFVSSIKFKYENSDVGIHWSTPASNKISVPLSHAKFYLRGDSISNVAKQLEADLLNTEDRIKLKNGDYFKTVVMRVAESAGYEKKDHSSVLYDNRIQKERDFHDAWAESEDVEKIDVIAANVVCTAPEMRFIANRLGDIKGKHLLDVGCGLGEASVYFAMLGADVTSSDLSQGMLDATTRLASCNGVNVKQHLASAEDMRLPVDVKFDIIYCGNLLHHVDIEDTITRVKPHLAKGGIFVSWDPLAYNPAINVYRSIATGVRTPDEHPLKWSDVKLFKKHFSEVETKYFWLTTLIIFVIMALAQRRNPNKERFWKVVVQEGDKWAWLYQPLERLDSFLLAVFPPLRLLCWNIVIVSKV